MRLSKWLWYVLLAATIVRGSSSLVTEFSKMRPVIEGPRSATDFYLNHLQVPGVSRHIEDSIRELPASEPLLFVAFRQEPAYLHTYYSLGYLTLPHQFGQLGCGLYGQPPRSYVPPQSGAQGNREVIVRGAFCLVVPCGPDGRRQRIGPSLEFVEKPIPIESLSWTTLCSP